MINDAVRRKRIRDNLDDTRAGFDTTPQEDSLLRQESPEDPASLEAEQTIESMRQLTPNFWRLHNPGELAKLKQELREESLRRNGKMTTSPPEGPGEERFNSDKFWNNPEELQKYTRPKKL